MVPLLLLLVVNVVNFGAFIYAWISVANSVRTGAEYFATGAVTVAGLTPPVAATVQSMVLDDLKSLPNQSSIQICISTSSSATVSCNKGTAPASAPPAADTAESGITYVTGAVDVSYTYSALVPAWDFPALKIHLTLPPTTIHRQSQMRILQ